MLNSRIPKLDRNNCFNIFVALLRFVRMALFLLMSLDVFVISYRSAFDNFPLIKKILVNYQFICLYSSICK